MYKITNISSDAKQSLNLILPDRDETVKVDLRYIPRQESWYMTVTYGGTVISGRRVCSGPNILRQWNNVFPFGLGCYTLDNTDPFFIDDFSNGRCGMFLLSEADVARFEEYLNTQKDLL